MNDKNEPALPIPRFLGLLGTSMILKKNEKNSAKVDFRVCTPTPWLTLLLVLEKSRVKQNSC